MLGMVLFSEPSPYAFCDFVSITRIPGKYTDKKSNSNSNRPRDNIREKYTNRCFITNLKSWRFRKPSKKFANCRTKNLNRNLKKDIISPRKRCCARWGRYLPYKERD
jgi:hypothetical protein